MNRLLLSEHTVVRKCGVRLTPSPSLSCLPVASHACAAGSRKQRYDYHCAREYPPNCHMDFYITAYAFTTSQNFCKLALTYSLIQASPIASLERPLGLIFGLPIPALPFTVTMTSTFRSATINAARTVTLLSLFSAAVMAHARPQDQMTHEQLHRRATQRYEGCYSSAGSLESDGSYMYQSTGYCGEQCTGKDQAVMGLTEGNSCWCGGSIPSDSDKVDDERCNSPCTGFGSDNCRRCYFRRGSILY